MTNLQLLWGKILLNILHAECVQLWPIRSYILNYCSNLNLKFAENLNLIIEATRVMFSINLDG